MWIILIYNIFYGCVYGEYKFILILRLIYYNYWMKFLLKLEYILKLNRNYFWLIRYGFFLLL